MVIVVPNWIVYFAIGYGIFWMVSKCLVIWDLYQEEKRCKERKCEYHLKQQANADI